MERLHRISRRDRMRKPDVWRGSRFRAWQGVYVQAEGVHVRQRVVQAVGELRRMQHEAELQLRRASPLRLRRELGRLAGRQWHNFVRAVLFRRSGGRPGQSLPVPAVGLVRRAHTCECRRRRCGRRSDVDHHCRPHLLLCLRTARHCPHHEHDMPRRRVGVRKGFGDCDHTLRLLRAYALRRVLRSEQACRHVDGRRLARVWPST
mmetsp:Transcript_14965/g.41092  ORF Transcript_14965/g.41092 Transcript_14965/m.41092 type:complete len:205 (-) Transcript_14965:1361-1975(-)